MLYEVITFVSPRCSAAQALSITAQTAESSEIACAAAGPESQAPASTSRIGKALLKYIGCSSSGIEQLHKQSIAV